MHLLNDYSGSPKVLSQVISICKEEGFEMEIYIGEGEKGFLSNLTDNQQFYYYKRFNNKYLTLFSFLFSQCYLFFKLLKHRKDDVVFYINTMLPFGAALAGKIMNKPIYYHIHETYIQPKLFKQFLRGIIQKTANKVVFVSEYLKCKEYFEQKDEFVIYNTLSQNFLQESKYSKYHSIKNDKFSVLMICSLKSYKGLDEFIKIAEICKSEKDIYITLVLNAQKPEIDTYFKFTKIPSNVTIESSQSEVIQFYKNSSLVLNLSKIDEVIETFGLTILEALAFGIPVIVPPVGGPAELVTDGVEGYLISSYKVDTITEKIIELSKNEKKCLELSNNAKKQSLCFNEETFRIDILKLFDA